MSFAKTASTSASSRAACALSLPSCGQQHRGRYSVTRTVRTKLAGSLSSSVRAGPSAGSYVAAKQMHSMTPSRQAKAATAVECDAMRCSAIVKNEHRGAHLVSRYALQRTASDLNTAAVCAWVASQAFLDTSQAASRYGFETLVTRSLASLTAVCNTRTEGRGGNRLQPITRG